MSEAEHPDRLREGHRVTVDDVRQLMGASTPHFALQLRERIRALIRNLEPDEPARIEGEREIARLDELAFAGERELVEAGDLPLSLDPRRLVWLEVADQRSDPLPQLEREVGRRGPHQLAHVVDGHPMPLAQTVWMLCFAHFCGTASRRVSISAWTETE